jgi:sarcosine oxidase delta subunit
MKTAEPALDSIKCPNCGELIPVSETIYHQIAEKARAESKAEIAKQQRELSTKNERLKKGKTTSIV